MSISLITITLLSLNAWSVSLVRNCSNNNLTQPITVCYQYPHRLGSIEINHEKIPLKFSAEEQPKATFTLSSNEQPGFVQLLEETALIQITPENEVYIACEKIKPGHCEKY